MEKRRVRFIRFFHSTAGIDDLLVLLCGMLGAAAFWSTALAETAGILILAAAAARIRATLRNGEPLQFCRTRPARIAFAFMSVYVAAVALSVLLAPGTFLRTPSLLWHPLLFPALMFPEIRRSAVVRAAKIFVAGGAAATAVTLAVNIPGGATSEPFTFTGVTTFSDLLVLAGAAGLSLVLPGSPLRLRLWSLAGAALVLPVVAWSGERAPAVAGACLGTIRAAYAGPRFFAGWLCIAGACVVFAPRALTEKMDWMMHGGQIDRYVVWGEGIRLAPSAPLFGHGPGSFARVLPLEAWGRFMQRPPASWHNDMLETWLDSGPLAAVALGGVLIVGVARALRALAAAKRDGRRSIAGEAGLLFVVLALFGAVGSVVTTSVLGLAFWVLLALTLNPPE